VSFCETLIVTAGHEIFETRFKSSPNLLHYVGTRRRLRDESSAHVWRGEIKKGQEN
jgi:hypothetical protein